MKGLQIIFLTFILILPQLLLAQNQSVPKREMRGVWIATVNNIDYPKRPTANGVAQKEQWNKMVQRLKKMGINTLFVQVRPAGDAFYESDLAPWSRFLTGKQGTPPVPYYDPMEYMIDVAHRNGMEFHAWLNPYRATFGLDTLALARNHVFNTHRDWLVQYGNKMYLNPGMPEVRRHIVQVVKEITEKYNIDGIHVDDYFYPYKIKGVEFPDSAQYAQYGEPHGSLGDWRRYNNDDLVKNIAITIKQQKPYVLFGVSPFGVWRNQEDDPFGSDTRAGVRSYDDLYADILNWLEQGWLDYVAPQLYFNIGYEPADYQKLLNWWRTHDYDRTLIIGQAAYKVGNNPVEAWAEASEVPNQINLNRRYPDVAGSIFFSTKSLMNNPLGLTDSLSNVFYQDRAISPFQFPEEMMPATPRLTKVKGTPEGVKLKWRLNKQVPTQGAGLLPADYYVVYRFSQGKPLDMEDPSNIIFISDLEGRHQCLIDKTTENGEIYTYAISAINKYRNESPLSNKIMVRKELGKVKKINTAAVRKKAKKERKRKQKKMKKDKKNKQEVQPSNTSF
ncbi:MAG: family 10 glycosylhydrolase [Bacteroidota bacterium]